MALARFPKLIRKPLKLLNGCLCFLVPKRNQKPLRRIMPGMPPKLKIRVTRKPFSSRAHIPQRDVYRGVQDHQALIKMVMFHCRVTIQLGQGVLTSVNRKQREHIKYNSHYSNSDWCNSLSKMVWEKLCFPWCRQASFITHHPLWSNRLSRVGESKI